MTDERKKLFMHLGQVLMTTGAAVFFFADSNRRLVGTLNPVFIAIGAAGLVVSLLGMLVYRHYVEPWMNSNHSF